MFYSHQLLARKAALGQIWMAATMRAKMNRRKLDTLNIIKICEEILNPSVPMALRLSGILMGGVVIIYERKVKLLYDDVTRLMVEVNDAWKVKARSGSNSTELPKRKSRARYEAITLPDNEERDAPEVERFLNFSNRATSTTRLQQGAYICVCLDNVDENYVTGNTGEEDVFQETHQADAENITLWEPFTSYQANTNLHNSDERFEEEGEIQLNFTPTEQVPSSFIPSPPHQNEQRGHPASEIRDQHAENPVVYQNQQMNGHTRKRGRRPAALIMDNEQIIIPGNVYQSWLQDASNTISTRRGKRRKKLMPNVKIAKLMELPPSTLFDGILNGGTTEIQWPAPLLELWMRRIQPPHDMPSERNFQPQPPEPSSSSPSNRVHQGPAGFPFEDFLSGVGSPSLGISIEKQRGTNHENDESQFDILMGSLRTNLMNDNGRTTEVVFTPGNSGGGPAKQARSLHGSASGHDTPYQTAEVNSERINKKRPYSWSRLSGSSLEPVDEEHPFDHPDPNFKLSRLAEDGIMAEHELLVETGPTQTENPIIPSPIEKITDSIRVHLKAHFDTPGATQKESLNQLASGMDRARAAQLFYQTCVLATRGFVRVEQNESYGDILISRGANM